MCDLLSLRDDVSRNENRFFNIDSTYGSDHDNIIIDHTGRSLSISIKGDAVGNRG